MQKLFLTSILLCFCHILFAQNAGDTIEVTTFNYSQTYGINQWSPGIRDSVITFPDDESIQYNRILMSYNMRCKDGNVSNGANTDLGCGEWDISCNTYIHDSTRIDSMRTFHPEITVSGVNQNNFEFVDEPTFTFFQYTQLNTEIESALNESDSEISNGTEEITNAINPLLGSGRSQFLYTSEELIAAGLSAGEIDGLKVEITNASSEINHFKILLKETADVSLESPSLEGFTQVFYQDYSPVLGVQHFPFAEAFEWDGTSNIILDLSYTNGQVQDDNLALMADLAPANTGVSSAIRDQYISIQGENNYIELPETTYTFDQGFSIMAWIKYDEFGNWSRIIDLGNGPNADNIIFANQGTSNNLTLDIRIGSSSTGIVANNVLTTGEWMHVAATLDLDGNANLYVNGELEASGTMSFPESILRSNNFIGKSNWTQDAFFQGAMDDVSMWNTALSQEEIQNWMRTDISDEHTQYDQLLFSYNFNDADENLSLDNSNVEYNGNLIGYTPKLIHRGDEIFKNFETSVMRPNLTMVTGDYMLNVTEIAVLDSLQNPAHVVNEYEIISNYGILEHDEVSISNTYNVWGTEEQVLDGLTNDLISTISNEASGSIDLTGELLYFRRWPSKIEIMSFVTPYGIGLDLGDQGKTWVFDVTDYAPILKGEKRMTIERGGQWMEDMDIRFHFIVGEPSREVLDLKQIWRAESSSYNNLLNERRFEPRVIELDSEASYYKVRSSISGHGQEGEFIPREHYININGGVNEFQWLVWKECADNPVYPQGGTWTFDRAGWCPGAPTDVQHLDISEFVSPGDMVEFDYGINTASGDSRYIINNQLVTYGSHNFENEVSIEEIVRPTSAISHARINPMCTNPIVRIQNNGTETLTSATITYSIQNGQELTHEWEGQLQFGESTLVELPAEDISFWLSSESNVFQASVSTEASDEFIFNNEMTTLFEPFDVYEENLFFRLRTNNQPNETSFTVKDSQGNILYSLDNLESNTTYDVGLNLAPGCYTAELLDSDDDGLSYWFEPAAGNGYLRLYEEDSFSVNFESEFGKFFSYDFYSTGSVGVDEVNHSEILAVYPNPSEGDFTINMTTKPNQDVTVQVTDAIGNVHYRDNYRSNTVGSIKENLNLQDIANGWYLIQIQHGDKVTSKKVVIQK